MEEKVFREALDLYGVTEQHLIRQLSGGTYNAVYEFEKDEKPFVIRIGEIEFDIEATNGMFEWLQILNSKGAAVPKLVRSIQNNLTEYIQTDSRNYSIDVTHKISGENARNHVINKQDLSWARAFGQAVGSIHRIATDLAPESVLRVRRQWNQIGSDFNPPVQLSSKKTRKERHHLVWGQVTLVLDNFVNDI